MIAMGSDHAGYRMKLALEEYLSKKGIEYKDCGTYSEDSCDYPVFGEAVGRSVASGECEKGILICGTGIGISIAANKVPGIRAAVCTDAFCAEMARRHNDANVLAMGARVIGQGVAEQLVDIFLNTEFEGGRHQRRVSLLDAIK